MEQPEAISKHQSTGTQIFRRYAELGLVGFVFGMLLSPVALVVIRVGGYQSADRVVAVGKSSLMLGYFVAAFSMLLLPCFLLLTLVMLYLKRLGLACIFFATGTGIFAGWLIAPNLNDWRETALVSAIYREEEHSKPLIEAIAKYNQDLGVYPPTLEALVSKYLPQVPRTSFAGHPRYQYYLPDPKDKYDRYTGYQLRISLGIPFDFDDLNHWAPGNNPNPFGEAGTVYGNWTFFDD